MEGTFKGGEIKASCVKSEGDNGTDITGLHWGGGQESEAEEFSGFRAVRDRQVDPESDLLINLWLSSVQFQGCSQLTRPDQWPPRERLPILHFLVRASSACSLSVTSPPTLHTHFSGLSFTLGLWPNYLWLLPALWTPGIA